MLSFVNETENLSSYFSVQIGTFILSFDFASVILHPLSYYKYTLDMQRVLLLSDLSLNNAQGFTYT